MAHGGVPPGLTEHGHRADTDRVKRQRRLSLRAVSVTVSTIVVAVAVTAACAPPNNPAGAGDGGVSVAPPATAAVTAPTPIDVASDSTNGLNGPMGLSPFASTAPAGDVTFTVKNLGTVEHEMIVLKTDTPFDQLPVTDSGDPPAPVTSGADKVDEADNVGETGDPNLKPGDTRTFTITGLAAGQVRARLQPRQATTGWACGPRSRSPARPAVGSRDHRRARATVAVALE